MSRYLLVSKENYNEFYAKTQGFDIGPMLLPKEWTNKLWGIVVYNENQLVAGWVGTKRINNKWITSIYQEVVFNSHPQIFEDSLNPVILIQRTVEKTIEFAKDNKIVNLIISPWARTKFMYNLSCFNAKINATFVVKLENADCLLNSFEHSQRKQIKKAIRNGLDFTVYDDSNIDSALCDFSKLRCETQKRAISQNNSASMLLKSISYYKDITSNYESKLVSVHFKDKIAAMLLLVKSGNYIYPYYAGSDIELNRATGASSFMYYKLMIYAKEQGCKYFDMGGCPVNPDKNHPAYGVYSFKKSFGGDYREYTCGDIVISKWKYNLMQFIKRNRSLVRMLSKKM